MNNHSLLAWQINSLQLKPYPRLQQEVYNDNYHQSRIIASVIEVGFHTLHYSYATHLLETGIDIRLYK